MLRMEPTQLCYSVGSEHDPGDPFGRCELTLEVDGSVRLLQVKRSGERRWSGRLVSAAAARIWSGLEQAGYPAVPQQPRVGGAAQRVVAIGFGAARRSATVGYHAGRKLPGYAEVFAVLDAVLHQLSQGAIEQKPAFEDVLVTDVKSE